MMFICMYHVYVFQSQIDISPLLVLHIFKCDIFYFAVRFRFVKTFSHCILFLGRLHRKSKGVNKS